MPLRLSFDSGPLAGIHIVTSSPTIRLGRDPSQNDILLTNPKVSRRHAIISRSVRGGWSLEVMGTGPSRLNGDAIQAVGGRPSITTLSTGDRLDFGGVDLVVSEAEVKLICVMGAAVGKEIAIDGTCRIGSGGDCDLVLADRNVAAEHMVITSTPLGFRADALAPVIFNGAPADSRVLSHGDEIVIGNSVIRFTVTATEELVEGPDTGMSSQTIVSVAPTNAVGELVFIAGSGKGERIPLGDNQIILGTRADCTMVLSDLLASPVHCAISKAGDQFIATDLQSESGTYINGERIYQGTALKPGDLIAVGSHVLESRLIGGVTQAKMGNTIFTTLSAGQLDLGPQPRFVLDGRVVKARKIVLGRAPSCDVIIDGPSVSREHCVLEWTEGFTAKDTSSAGTYIDDKRIVAQPLPPTCVIRIVDTLFRVAVRGEVCTLERTDALLAQAAVDVARAQASMMTQHIQVSPSPSAMLGAAGAAGPIKTTEGLKTVFRMDVGALELQIAARKKDLRKNAPAWRASSDLKRDAALRGTVVLSVLAAVALCGGALFLGRGQALVNHPLSTAHSSQKFVEQMPGVTVCSACHSAGATVAVDKCAGCHQGFDQHALKTVPANKAEREKKEKEHHALPCTDCHNEHVGDGPDHSLFANGKCKDCHSSSGTREPKADPKGHAEAFAGKAPAGVVKTDKKNDKDLDIEAMHQKHVRVKGPDGNWIGIGCTTCHGKTDANGTLDEKEPGNPRMSCFRCHPGGENAMKDGCLAGGCHPKDHKDSLVREPDSATNAPKSAMSNPVQSLGWATGIALVGVTPGLLFGLFVRLRRRKLEASVVEDLRAQPAEVVKRLVHSINDSKCVGCSMCVQACPASVLELVDHKSRVVNFDACIQCKKCEKACAFDALRMHDADKPPPMIPMPSVDAFHETPVQGMYLVGQASGVPQVKNATNLGRAVVQRIVQAGFRPGTGRQMGCDVDVIVAGSGPAGLSAVMTCIELGLSYVVLEKERAFSWTIRNYYHKGKEVMAEPHDVALEATLPHWDSSREELLGAWEELINQNRVDIRYQQNVIDVKKEGDKFVIKCGTPGAPADEKKGTPAVPPNITGTFSAPRVVLAIGTLGNPRKLGCPGDELEKVKNSLVDPEEWQGKQVMVVGGSDSAVEVVLALSRPELRNKVTFSTRGAKLEGIKPKNRKLIEDALAAGKFEIRYATALAEVTATTCAFTHNTDGRREEIPNDVVFALIGGNSPQKWLQSIGVPYVDKPHSWSPPRTDLLAQKTAEGMAPIRRLPRRPIPQRDPHH
ncbi:MAG: FHA domain-containing protein [Deltaproteobacteria bacterium]|nr:FHA domain-containing protein [Deltaproteobacteria bacterium]